MATPNVSFEVFPPRTVDAAFKLWDSAQALAPLAPRFFSVTYGAGGTTRDLTHDAAHVLRRTSGLPVAAHLTCVGASRAETMEVADKFAEAGITDIVALRGDPQAGTDKFVPHPEGFAGTPCPIQVPAISAMYDTRKQTEINGSHSSGIRSCLVAPY